MMKRLLSPTHLYRKVDNLLVVAAVGRLVVARAVTVAVRLFS
jgi:hypothetical protein